MLITLSILLSILLSIVSSAVISRFSSSIALVDIPNERSSHSLLTPRGLTVRRLLNICYLSLILMVGLRQPSLPSMDSK